MSRLRRWLLGPPERLDLPGLDRALRLGDADLRARAARVLAARGGHAERLAPALDDPVPALRRAAAVGLGRSGDARWAEVLLARAAREPCDTPQLLQLAGALALGVPEARARAPLEARFARRLFTARGWRSHEAALGVSVEARWARVLAFARGLTEAPGDDPEALACTCDPDRLDALLAARHSAGRRGDHRVLLALGLHGDPRALDPLLRELERMDVDPGRGFAQRRSAAASIGMIGLPRAARRLLSALETEALEHEGRPGAGLGVQFPVRARLLDALGEVQAPEAAPALAAYLGNLHGAALGGLHLPAMGALVKLGRAGALAAARVARLAPEEAAANALGVLVALADEPAAREALAEARSGPRAALARQALAGP